MYKAVKKAVGTHSHPSHPRWIIKNSDRVQIGTAHNSFYADKIVKLLNEDAEKLGMNQDAEVTTCT